MRALVAPLLVGLAPVLILALLLIGPSLGLVKWQPPVLWTTQFGTNGRDVQNGITAVSADSSGLYSAGFVGYPSALVDPPSSYLFVSRYDLTGRQAWTQHFGKGDYEIKGVAVGADGVYVAAWVNGTYFLQKYDLDGKAVWTSQLGKVPSNTSITSISVGSAGVYVGGSAATGPGSAQIVGKYDSNGNMVWTRTVGNDTGGSVVYSGPSGVYIASSQLVKLFYSHPFVSKYDTNGTLDWIRGFDSPPSFMCNCEPSSISGDASGLYVAGPTMGSLFVRKYDWSGDVLWTVQLPSPDYSGIGTLQMSANPSGVYLAGTTVHVNGFVTKYDGNGNQAWLILVHQVPAAISAGEDGVYVGGTNGYAFIEKLGQSSSLILFGVNPPFSFGFAVLLGGAAILSLLWLRMRRKKKVRPPSMVSQHGPRRSPKNTRF